MTIIRRSRAASDSVDVGSRLAGYEVTSTVGLDRGYASGYSTPATPPHGAPGQIPAPVDVPNDRRGAPRCRLQVPVRATAKAGEPWQEGTTVDVSLTGVCIEMGRPPDLGYLDLEIDAQVTIAAWARVVGSTPIEGARHRWRLRLVSYDATYPALLDGLEPLETGFAPPPVEPEPSLGEDDALVAADV